MNPQLVNLDTLNGTEQQTAALVKLLRAEFAAGVGNFTGYRFIYDFDAAEVVACKRWSKTATGAAESMVSTLKAWERVVLFRNGLGELCAKVVDPTRRTEALWLKALLY